MEDIVFYYACKFFGDWERIYDAVEKQEDIDFDEIEELKELHKDSYITIYSSDYPAEMRLIKRPPFVLFLKGKRELIRNKNKVWIFGSYYDEEVDKFASKQNKDFQNERITLISGYSSEFERSFINNNPPKNMIIIRDSGIESNINMTKIEEKLFIKDNLIVSEYPDKVIPSLYSWENSNRIKAGMCSKLYLLNSEKEPITFKLISETLDEHRDVYCFNEDVTEKSHNSILINKGAYAINNIKELKEKRNG